MRSTPTKDIKLPNIMICIAVKYLPRLPLISVEMKAPIGTRVVRTESITSELGPSYPYKYFRLSFIMFKFDRN